MSVEEALGFLQALSADRRRRAQGLPLNRPGHLKNVYVGRKQTQRCKVCNRSSFSKYGRGEQGFFCLRIICDFCGATSLLLLDEKLCDTCVDRIDCLSGEIELVTAEIICLLI